MTKAETETMRRFDTGKTLLEHLLEIGVVPADVDAGPVVPFDRIRAYLELHIEQGPLLEDLSKPIGLATAIRGNIRYPFAKCFGRYAHSAAVPRHLRHDALMATVKLIAFADQRWKAEIDAGHDDLVFTCGIFQTNSTEHSMTKIPGEITFTLNIGSISDDVMERMHRDIADKADILAKEHHVRFDFGKRVGTGAVGLSADITKTFVRAAETVGIVPHSLPTVGHDAAMFARNGVPTGMILVRNTNGSHNPEEHMEMNDFIDGLKVLASSANEIVSQTNWCGADEK
jgi:N-carbamoyl-L-amino-acid hydrolase